MPAQGPLAQTDPPTVVVLARDRRQESPMYAVIATGGKQYRVREGDTLDVERLDAGDDGTVDLRPVMLVGDDGEVTVEAKALAGASVTASVVEDRRGKKLTVFNYRNKTGYRRKKGHRQSLTRIRVDQITS